MISMGGSSIWFTSIAIGIVLSVSKYVDEMEGERKNAARLAAVAAAEAEAEAASEEVAVAALKGKKTK
jgi:cell division protein FtsW